MTDLLQKLVAEIESWTEGYQMRVNLANDGDGNFDFMGFSVTEDGKMALQRLLDQS